MSHFLQGPEWACLQEELHRPGLLVVGDGYRARAYLERGRLNSRLYSPYGPELDTVDALLPAIAALRDEARRRGAAFLRIDPVLNDPEHPAVPAELLRQAGLRRVHHRQPEFTQRVSLDRTFEETLLQMRKRLRSQHRNYAKHGLSVRQSQAPEDIEQLIRLLAEVSDRTGMIAHGPDYLRAQARVLLPSGAAKLFFVQLEGEPDPIAAAMVFDDETTRYYIHAAADTAHRKLPASAILITAMMADSTEAGQREFDLFGTVPVAVRDHPWTGFSDFKRSFGGREIAFSGTWELPIRHLSYGIYRLAQRFVD